MSKRFCCALLVCGAMFHLSAANETGAIPAAGAAMAGTALFRADVALAKSIVSPTDFRGSLGENVAGQCFLKNTLSQTGNWQAITPRSGRQGLDHLFVKTDSRGVPTKLLIGESKYNTSRLGKTRDGIQMGKRWIDRQLVALGSRYLDAAGKSDIAIARMPLNPNRSIEVTLPNGAHRHFWKGSSKDTWKFSGTKSELAVAKVQASRYGLLLQKAGSDIISYRSRIFNILPRGNDLEIVVYDAANVDHVAATVGRNAVVHELKRLSTFKLKNALSDNGKLSKGVVDDMAKTLQRKLRLSDSEAMAMARNVRRQYTVQDLLKPTSIHKEIFTSKALWGGVGIASAISLLDVTAQLIASDFDFRSVDWRPAVLGPAGAFIGLVSGHYANIGLRRFPYARKIVRRLSGSLHCSSGTMATLISSNFAGIVASAIFSYGMYFWGEIDLQTANRQMLAGSTSVAAGTGAWIVMKKVQGPVPRGLPAIRKIPTLGPGIVVVVVVVAVDLIIDKLFELKDEHDETQRIAYMLNFFSREENLRKALAQSGYR